MRNHVPRLKLVPMVKSEG